MITEETRQKMKIAGKKKERIEHMRRIRYDGTGKKRSENFKKKISEILSKNSVYKKCFVCGKEFKVPPSRGKTAKYCSSSCHNKQMDKGKEHRIMTKNINREKRRARENNAAGSFTVSEWTTLKAQYNWTCPGCKKSEPEIKLTIDHIIPLIRGGSHNIENIQPLCIKCNCRKHTKIIKYE